MFGRGSADFWLNQVEGVGQAIKTRLMLWSGEWFLDLSEGTPWGGFNLAPTTQAQGQILGERTSMTRDLAIKIRVLGTPGVQGIASYFSSFNGDTRRFSVNMIVDTIYGKVALTGATLEGVFTLDVLPLDGGEGLG